MIYQTQIDGETWTFYRTHSDMPYEEVQAQRGEFVEGRRPDAWINTQYATVSTDAGEGENAELVREARTFQSQRHLSVKVVSVGWTSPAKRAEGDPAITWQGQASMDDPDSIF